MLSAGQTLDRYTVETLLGTGGMAVVYRVRHNQLDSLHALKVLTVTSPQIKERLLQEGKVQAALRHPNIVAVTDVIEVAGAPGLVMEFVDGPALDEWLERNEPELDEAERLFRGILSGVAAAHARGVVHRDLKPANVMLAGSERLPKVTDFGLAKAFVDSKAAGLRETRSGMTMGTPAYMAPEQIRDAKAVDARADVFSLGCILYELVCGRPAFEGPDILSIFNAVARGEFQPPVSLVPDLPGPIHDAILGALVVDRERRIPDCATLERVLDGGRWSRSRGPGSTPTWDGAPVPATNGPRAGNSLPTVVPEDELPMGASLTAEGSLPPRTRTASMGSLTPRRRWWLAGGVVTAGIGLAALLVAAGVGVFLVQRDWVRRSSAHVDAALGAPVAFGSVSLRPGRVGIYEVSIPGEAGSSIGAAAVVAEGSWGFEGGRLGFTPTGARIEELSLHAVRAAGGWHAPEALLSRLRTVPDTALQAIEVDGLLIEFRDGSDALQLRAERAGWVPMGQGWALQLEDWRLGSLAGGERLALGEDGVVRAEGLDLTLEVDRDGRLIVPVGLRDAVPVYHGGSSPRGDLGGVVESVGRYLPSVPTTLVARSGQLVLLDRAHGVKAVRWEAELSQLTLGPQVDGFLPFDAVASLGGGRLALEGDVDADGLLRGRASARRVPLGPVAAYLQDGATRRGIELQGGVVNGELRFSAKGESLATRLAIDIGGARLFGPGAAAVPIPDGPVRVEQESIGSLAEQRFRPAAEWLDAIEVALLGEAPMADVVAAPPPPPAGMRDGSVGGSAGGGAPSAPSAPAARTAARPGATGGSSAAPPPVVAVAPPPAEPLGSADGEEQAAPPPVEASDAPMDRGAFERAVREGLESVDQMRRREEGP